MLKYPYSLLSTSVIHLSGLGFLNSAEHIEVTDIIKNKTTSKIFLVQQHLLTQFSILTLAQCVVFVKTQIQIR